MTNRRAPIGKLTKAGLVTALFAAGIIVAAPAAYAAEGTLTGSVVDDNAAAIGGGSVILFEPEPGIAPNVTTAGTDGTFSVSAEPGPYYLMALPPSGSALAPSAPVDVASDCEDCPAVVTGGQTVAVGDALALRPVTVQGTVTDENNIAISDAFIIFMSGACMGGGGPGDGPGDGDGEGSGGGGGSVGGDGGGGDGGGGDGGGGDGGGGDGECTEFFSISDANGAYRLGASAGSYMAFVYNPNNARMTPPATVNVVDGSVLTLDLTFPTPNITGTVQRASDSTPYANAFIMAEQCDQSFYETMGDCMMMGEGGFGATGADGTFALALTTAGVYKLVIEPAWGDTTVAGWSETFVLAQNGSKTTWGSPASNVIQLVAPNITGTVRRPDTNAPISDVWVMALPIGEGGQETWPPAAEGPSGDNGAYGFSVPAGDYVFRAEIPWWDNDLAGFMAVKERVTVVGPGTPQTVDLTLGIPNVSGTFKSAEGTPVKWGWIEVCLAPGTDWQLHCQLTTADSGWPGGEIRETGAFSINLHPYTRNEEYVPVAETSGPFTLTFYPDEFQNSGVAKTTVTVTMNDTPALNTSVSAAESGGVSVLQGDGTLAVIAAAPNLSGTVWNPVTNTAYTSAPGSWDRGHVCAENPTTWSWDCVGVSADGTFGIALDDGSYTIHVEPAWGTSTVSAVSFSATVSGGTVTATGAAASQSAAGAAVTVTLGEPNFKGTVKTGAGAGLGDGHIEIMKAQTDSHGTWYEWVNWAHIADNGVFAQKVEDGTYKVQANPGWNMSGYASTEANITISGTTLTCNSGCTIEDGSIVMTWGSPNFSGVVMNPSTSAGDPEAQLEIFKKVDGSDPPDGDVTDPEDWDMWEAWAMGSRTGTFGVRLDGGASGETYTIKVMPGWRTTGLSSSSYTVVVAANDSVTSVTGSGGAVSPGEDGSYSLVLSTPNVSGSVVKADGTTAAIDAHIDIQKWNDGSSPPDGDFVDPEDYTQWEDWSHSRPKVQGETTTAAYGVSLSEGTYEVWIWPAWTDTSSIRQRTTVVVNSSGVATCGSGNVPAGLPTAGCVVDGSTGAINFTLATSNVAGDVTNSEGQAVTWSSVDILKDTDSNTSNGYEAWATWAEIQGGTNAGKFATYLEDGDYRLRIFPSWSDTKSQPKNVDINVNGGSASCTTGCTVTNGRLVVALAAGNVTGTVQTSAAGNAGLGNALVMVVTDAANTNGTFGDHANERIADTTSGATGEFSVQVPVGNNYKLKIQPAPLASGNPVDQVKFGGQNGADATFNVPEVDGEPGPFAIGNFVLTAAGGS